MAEKKFRYYFTCLGIVTFFASFSLATTPLIIIIYKYNIGTLNSSDWIQSMSTVYMMVFFLLSL